MTAGAGGRSATPELAAFHASLRPCDADELYGLHIDAEGAERSSEDTSNLIPDIMKTRHFPRHYKPVPGFPKHFKPPSTWTYPLPPETHTPRCAKVGTADSPHTHPTPRLVPCPSVKVRFRYLINQDSKLRCAITLSVDEDSTHELAGPSALGPQLPRDEQLTAFYERLAARDEQLTACNEQLTACNEQLKTSHEQLSGYSLEAVVEKIMERRYREAAAASRWHRLALAALKRQAEAAVAAEVAAEMAAVLREAKTSAVAEEMAAVLIEWKERQTAAVAEEMAAVLAEHRKREASQVAEEMAAVLSDARASVVAEEMADVLRLARQESDAEVAAEMAAVLLPDGPRAAPSPACVRPAEARAHWPAESPALQEIAAEARDVSAAAEADAVETARETDGAADGQAASYVEEAMSAALASVAAADDLAAAALESVLSTAAEVQAALCSLDKLMEHPDGPEFPLEHATAALVERGQAVVDQYLGPRAEQGVEASATPVDAERCHVSAACKALVDETIDKIMAAATVGAHEKTAAAADQEKIAERPASGGVAKHALGASPCPAPEDASVEPFLGASPPRAELPPAAIEEEAAAAVDTILQAALELAEVAAVVREAIDCAVNSSAVAELRAAAANLTDEICDVAARLLEEERASRLVCPPAPTQPDRQAVPLAGSAAAQGLAHPAADAGALGPCGAGVSSLDEACICDVAARLVDEVYAAAFEEEAAMRRASEAAHVATAVVKRAVANAEAAASIAEAAVHEAVKCASEAQLASDERKGEADEGVAAAEEALSAATVQQAVACFLSEDFELPGCFCAEHDRKDASAAADQVSPVQDDPQPTTPPAETRVKSFGTATSMAVPAADRVEGSGTAAALAVNNAIAAALADAAERGALRPLPNDASAPPPTPPPPYAPTAPLACDPSSCESLAAASREAKPTAVAAAEEAAIATSSPRDSPRSPSSPPHLAPPLPSPVRETALCPSPRSSPLSALLSVPLPRTAASVDHEAPQASVVLELVRERAEKLVRTALGAGTRLSNASSSAFSCSTADATGGVADEWDNMSDISSDGSEWSLLDDTGAEPVAV